jgi:adenosylmethionine-8-amino-7-oxononanoate aminotransferase
MITAPALIATRGEIDELVSKTKISVDKTAQEIGVL